LASVTPDIREVRLESLEAFGWRAHGAPGGTAPILLIEVNEVAVIRGRAMMRERLRSGQQPELPSARKRAADLVHLSTAIWLKVDEFWTYDSLDFSKYPQQDVTVREPYGEQMLMPGVDL